MSIELDRVFTTSSTSSSSSSSSSSSDIPKKARLGVTALPIETLDRVVFTYLPENEQAQCALICKAFRGVFHFKWGATWDVLKQYPNLTWIIESSDLIKNAPTVNKKLKVLGDLLRRCGRATELYVGGFHCPTAWENGGILYPKDNLELFIRWARGATPESALIASRYIEDAGFFRRANIGGLPESTIRSALRVTLDDVDNNLWKIKQILLRCIAREKTLPFFFSMAINSKNKNLINHVMTMDFDTSIGLLTATEQKDLNLIKEIIQKGSYSDKYDPDFKIRNNNVYGTYRAGLQGAIEYAIDLFFPEALALLMKASPNLAILLHARDSAMFNNITLTIKEETPERVTDWSLRLTASELTRFGNACPNRFKNQQVRCFVTKPGDRTGMITLLNLEIQRRFSPSEIAAEELRAAPVVVEFPQVVLVNAVQAAEFQAAAGHINNMDVLPPSNQPLAEPVQINTMPPQRFRITKLAIAIFTATYSFLAAVGRFISRSRD